MKYEALDTKLSKLKLQSPTQTPRSRGLELPNAKEKRIDRYENLKSQEKQIRSIEKQMVNTLSRAKSEIGREKAELG